MGREADAREAAERDRARIAFAKSPQLYDRFGRPLMIGCDLEYHDPLPAVYQIIDIKPDLRKDVPPNAYLVTMRSTVILMAISRRPMDLTTLVNMPAVIAEPSADQPGTPAQDRDDAAAPQSSIVLTDMDRTARETLAEAIPPPPPPPPAAPPLALVPQAPPAKLPDPPPPPDPDEEIVF